jgi:hypothetical protein
MWCPSCGAEYVPGVQECPDCRVTLVETPPPPPAAAEFEEILRTFNQGDIALIKSILDDAGFQYFFQGEIFNLVDPLIQPARLRVRKDQAGEARELLKGMNVSFLAVSVRDEGLPPS